MATIEATKGSEDMGQIGAFHRDVHELREGRCRIDAIGQRDRKRNTPANNRKSFIISCSPSEDRSAYNKPSTFAPKAQAPCQSSAPTFAKLRYLTGNERECLKRLLQYLCSGTNAD